MASQKRINSSATSTKAEAENKLLLTLSLSLPLCFTLSFACMHKQSQSRAHTHRHSCKHPYTHTDLLPRYVHDLTLVSQVNEHQAVSCNTKFSTFSTHRLIPSLYTFELFLDFSGNYYSWGKLYRNLHK